MVTMLSMFSIFGLGVPYFSFPLPFPAAVFIYLFSLPFLSFLFTFFFLLFLSSSILLLLLLFVFLLAHVYTRIFPYIYYVVIIFLKYVNFYLLPTAPYSFALCRWIAVINVVFDISSYTLYYSFQTHVSRSFHSQFIRHARTHEHTYYIYDKDILWVKRSGITFKGVESRYDPLYTLCIKSFYKCLNIFVIIVT